MFAVADEVPVPDVPDDWTRTLVDELDAPIPHEQPMASGFSAPRLSEWKHGATYGARGGLQAAKTGA